MAKVSVNAKIETQMKAKLEIISRKNSLSYADVVRMVPYGAPYERDLDK